MKVSPTAVTGELFYHRLVIRVSITRLVAAVERLQL